MESWAGLSKHFPVMGISTVRVISTLCSFFNMSHLQGYSSETDHVSLSHKEECSYYAVMSVNMFVG
jgi:hypothetical protein